MGELKLVCENQEGEGKGANGRDGRLKFVCENQEGEGKGVTGSGESEGGLKGVRVKVEKR